jgi:hypothetical protein
VTPMPNYSGTIGPRCKRKEQSTIPHSPLKLRRKQETFTLQNGTSFQNEANTIPYGVVVSIGPSHKERP